MSAEQAVLQQIKNQGGGYSVDATAGVALLADEEIAITADGLAYPNKHMDIPWGTYEGATIIPQEYVNSLEDIGDGKFAHTTYTGNSIYRVHISERVGSVFNPVTFFDITITTGTTPHIYHINGKLFICGRADASNSKVWSLDYDFANQTLSNLTTELTVANTSIMLRGARITDSVIALNDAATNYLMIKYDGVTFSSNQSTVTTSVASGLVDGCAIDTVNKTIFTNNATDDINIYSYDDTALTLTFVRTFDINTITGSAPISGLRHHGMHYDEASEVLMLLARENPTAPYQWVLKAYDVANDAGRTFTAKDGSGLILYGQDDRTTVKPSRLVKLGNRLYFYFLMENGIGHTEFYSITLPETDSASNKDLVTHRCGINTSTNGYSFIFSGNFMLLHNTATTDLGSKPSVFSFEIGNIFGVKMGYVGKDVVAGEIANVKAVTSPRSGVKRVITIKADTANTYFTIPGVNLAKTYKTHNGYFASASWDRLFNWNFYKVSAEAIDFYIVEEY